MRMLRNLAVGMVSLAVVSTSLADLPVGNAFTFQGNLVLNNETVDQACDFEFRLYDDPIAGNQVGATLTLNNEDVVAGTFTTLLDFGAQFDGKARFLEIAVRTPAGAGAFTTLSPRQELTPAPYASGLSLPYAGTNDDNGNAFSMTNDGLGRAANFQINNVASTSAALNAVTNGIGPAAAFLNDSGGTTVQALATFTGTAIYAESPSGQQAVHGIIALPAAPGGSAAVRGENKSNQADTYGVFGSSLGTGHGVFGTSAEGAGVFGEGPGAAGFGVYGTAKESGGTGVYGSHTNQLGTNPGVDGVTDSAEAGSAGVRGIATAINVTDPNGGSNPDGGPNGEERGTTYGVLGQSSATEGVGVRGESFKGVEGEGNRYGVFGTATHIAGYGVWGEATYGVYGLGNNGGAGVTGLAGNNSTIGVHAIGGNSRLAAPALRADAGNSGVGIYALGGRAIEGEGSEFGIRGITWEATGVGGTFSNLGGGTALTVHGRAEVNGTMAVDVLEIMGGADLAERFLFSEDARPGMVVAIDPERPGHMKVSRKAYNTRVAGVISGANELAAGVVLGDEPGHDRNLPVALSGRVWVQVDTRENGVEPGDFMTTSDLAGYAMAASDRERAEGAVIGKAMTGLGQGEEGMVLVLVNLQ